MQILIFLRKNKKQHEKKQKYKLNEDQMISVIFIGFSIIILLSPLPLGSDRPLAWDLLAFWIACLILGSLTCWPRDLRIFRKDLTVPALLFSAILIFTAVQIAPFSSPWNNPLWHLASESLDRDITGSISVDRQAGLTGLLRILSDAGVFVLSLILCRTPSRARLLVKLITFGGGVYAAYGLIVYWSGNKALLWFSKWAYEGDLTGSFVNRNSFATFLGLCFLTALCQLFNSFSRLHLYGSPRDQTHTILEFLSNRWWLFLTLFLLATALVLTHSRAGLLSSLVGVLTFIIALSQAPSLGRFRHLGLIGFPAVLVVLAFMISGGETLERMMETTLDSEERMSVFRQTWQAITDYPLVGSGLGSFASFFPLYRTADIAGYFDLAHNDYLQNFLELGIPAATCLFVTLLWLAGLCVRGVRTRRRDVVYPCLGVAASSLVGLHAVVDFSLQIPAVTTLYMALLGLAVAQSRSTQLIAETSIIAD